MAQGNIPDFMPIDSRTARILPWVVAIAFFMQTLDGTILNTALPGIATSMGVHPLRMHMVVIAYLLTVALCIPVSGWLADRFGIRQVFLASIAVFSVGSLACALSSSLWTLTASRVLQGVGGAILIPIGRLSVLRLYPRDQLVSILSFVTIPGLLGPLAGPTLGGLLVDYASWHWIFLINLPIGLIGILCTLRYMPDIPRLAGQAPFDRYGFLFFGSFMLTMTLALEGMGGYTLFSHDAILLSGISALSLVAYVVYSRRARTSLFPPRLFTVRHFSVGIAGNLLARFGLGAMPFLTPLLLQVGLGFSPLNAGLSMIPMSAGAIVAKSAVTPLINRMGFRALLVINTVLLGISLCSFALIDRNTPLFFSMFLFTLFGILNSIQFSAMNTITLIDLPDEQASSGNSLLSVIMQLSMSMGIAIATIILNRFSGIPAIASAMDINRAFACTYLSLGVMTMLSATIFSRVAPFAGKQCAVP
jgi:EmrB/QacA subfamily drug resistance transporter